MQKRERKVRKNYARINEKKSERSEKLHTSIRRAKACLYQEKRDVSLELNKAAPQGILNFRAKGIKSDGQEKSTKILISWQEFKNQFLSFFVHR